MDILSRRFVCRAAAALAILASAATRAGDVREAVMCAEVSFSRAAERREPDTFAAFLDEEARFVSGEVLRGPEAIVAAWSGFFAADGPGIRWRPAIVEVVADGTLAISRGTYRIRGADRDGNAAETWGTFNSVWRRNAQGEWRVLFDAGGEAREPTQEDRRIIAQEPACP